MPKGWFRIPGVQDGQRTIEEQLKGLGPLLEEIGRRRTFRICDLGSAEGMILKACRDAGAHDVAGLELVPQYAAAANKLLGGPVVQLADLNTPTVAWPIDADVVLMLAILHKLRDPFRLVDQVIAHGPELVVVRLPASTPGFVRDKRSGGVKFDITGRFARGGFDLELEERGHFDEWVGYYRWDTVTVPGEARQ